jgi:ABC-type branched-subunit amino acid transport system ATPase component
MQAIMSLSDRIVVVNAGKVIAEGSPAEIGANPDVVQAYLGEEYVHAGA